MRLGRDLLEKDLYSVLGVSPHAAHGTIKAAYRRRVADCHPDLAPTDRPRRERLLVALNQAATILLDPASRTAYDRSRAGLFSPPPSHSAPRPWSPASPFPVKEPVSESELSQLAARFKSPMGHACARFDRILRSLNPRAQAMLMVACMLMSVSLVACARPRAFVQLLEGEQQGASASAADISRSH